MKVINITQSSGGSYSHPNYCLDMAGSDGGIDFAFALGNYWKCISGPWGYNTYFFTACDAKGNPVKVRCADNLERVVTIAMTHANFGYVQRPVIGKIYSNGEPFYEEGTYGYATGNHIHFEVAEGLQYGKYMDESMGVYRMPNELRPESVCFICDSFSTVISTGGVAFRHCPGVYSEDIYMEMKVGMNTYEYGGIKFTAFVKPEQAKFGLFNYKELSDIKANPNGDNSKIRFIEKCGNDMFQMNSAASDPIGTVYGPRVCVNGPIDQPYMQKDKYLYYRVDKDGTVSFGDYTGNYIDPTWVKDAVQMCCSPQMIFSDDWAVPKYAPMAGGSDILKADYYQAYFGRTKDGKFFSGVSKDKISAVKLWSILRENFGIKDLAFMDGGSGNNPGSAQQIYFKDGETIETQYTGRKVRDILAFYYEDDTVVYPPAEEPTEQIPETPAQTTPSVPSTDILPANPDPVTLLIDKEFKKLRAEIADLEAENERLRGIIAHAKEVLNDV